MLRLLALVRVSRTGVYLQFLPHVPTQCILGKHTLDGKFDHTIRVRCDHSPKRNMLLAPHVTRVGEVRFLVGFAPRQRHLFSIDHDDVIADIQVRRIHGLVLATEDSRDTCGQPAQGFAFGIDEPPTTLDVVRFRSVGFHSLSAQKINYRAMKNSGPFSGCQRGKAQQLHGFSTFNSLLKKGLQKTSPRGVPETNQGFLLDLPNPLPGDAHERPDLLEGHRLLVV